MQEFPVNWQLVALNNKFYKGLQKFINLTLNENIENSSRTHCILWFGPLTCWARRNLVPEILKHNVNYV